MSLEQPDWKRRYHAKKAECEALETQVQTLREVAYRTIDRFQDIMGWQPGESRNRLVCEIRDAVDAALAVTEPKETLMSACAARRIGI